MFTNKQDSGLLEKASDLEARGGVGKE